MSETTTTEQSNKTELALIERLDMLIQTAQPHSS